MIHVPIFFCICAIACPGIGLAVFTAARHSHRRQPPHVVELRARVAKLQQEQRNFKTVIHLLR